MVLSFNIADYIPTKCKKGWFLPSKISQKLIYRDSIVVNISILVFLLEMLICKIDYKKDTF